MERASYGVGRGEEEASLVPQPQRRVPLPLTRPRTEARLMGRYRCVGFSYLTYIHTYSIGNRGAVPSDYFAL